MNGHWPFWLFWIILWVFIWPLFWIVIRRLRHRPDKYAGNNVVQKTPLEILKERYAKGEINKQEFEEKKNDLV